MLTQKEREAINRLGFKKLFHIEGTLKLLMKKLVELIGLIAAIDNSLKAKYNFLQTATSFIYLGVTSLKIRAQHKALSQKLCSVTKINASTRKFYGFVAESEDFILGFIKSDFKSE